MLIAQNIVDVNTHHRGQNQKIHTSTSSTIEVERTSTSLAKLNSECKSSILKDGNFICVAYQGCMCISFYEA